MKINLNYIYKIFLISYIFNNYNLKFIYIIYIYIYYYIFFFIFLINKYILSKINNINIINIIYSNYYYYYYFFKYWDGTPQDVRDKWEPRLDCPRKHFAV